MPIKVALVEDNPDLRLGTSFILKNSPECELVGVYESAEEFLEDLASAKPEVVLMDIELPGISGVEATARLKKKQQRTQVVILSVFGDDDNVFKAICAGANGYIAKPVSPAHLLEAVEYAFSGGTPFSPHIARKVLDMFKKNLPPAHADYNLTPRELEVLTLLTQGFEYNVIAEKMFVSPFTIRAHIRNIYDKLHVHSKSEAIIKALKENVIVSR